VVQWSIATARKSVDGVVVVVPEGYQNESFGADVCVVGGATRSDSVRNGLEAVPEDAAVVLVHDAARPLASVQLFVGVLEALEDPEVAGAICAIPVSDTLKKTVGETVVATIDRADLVAVQTPQGFRADILRRAHAGGGNATDDAALVEALGGTVRIVSGDPRNVKLTTEADLRYAEYVLAG
jgi:2-C-methyl-D-erythritol 4-phosphate cytidylyltransferase